MNPRLICIKIYSALYNDTFGRKNKRQSRKNKIYKR